MHPDPDYPTITRTVKHHGKSWEVTVFRSGKTYTARGICGEQVIAGRGASSEQQALDYWKSAVKQSDPTD